MTAPSGVGEVQSHCCSCSHASKARWVDRYGAGRVPFFSAWLVILLLIASVMVMVFNAAPGASSGRWGERFIGFRSNAGGAAASMK